MTSNSQITSSFHWFACGAVCYVGSSSWPRASTVTPEHSVRDVCGFILYLLHLCLACTFMKLFPAKPVYVLRRKIVGYYQTLPSVPWIPGRNCTKYLVTSVICIVSLYQFCKLYPLIFESAEICCSVTALINALAEIMWPWHCGHVVIVPELLATTHFFFSFFFFLLELSGVWLSKSTPQNLDTGYVAWSTLSGPRVCSFVPINREILRSSHTAGNSASSGLLQKFSCVLSQIRNSDSFGIKWEVTLSQVKWGDNRDQNLA